MIDSCLLSFKKRKKKHFFGWLDRDPNPKTEEIQKKPNRIMRVLIVTILLTNIVVLCMSASILGEFMFVRDMFSCASLPSGIPVRSNVYDFVAFCAACAKLLCASDECVCACVFPVRSFIDFLSFFFRFK